MCLLIYIGSTKIIHDCFGGLYLEMQGTFKARNEIRPGIDSIPHQQVTFNEKQFGL